MPRRFQNREQNFRAGNTSNFARQLAGVMSAMRQLKAEHVAPKCQRAFDVGNRKTSMIDGENLKRRAHKNSSRDRDNL